MYTHALPTAAAMYVVWRGSRARAARLGLGHSQSCELRMQMRRTTNSRVGSMTAIWQVVKRVLKEKIKKQRELHLALSAARSANAPRKVPAER
jgi:hypothetical protein